MSFIQGPGGGGPDVSRGWKIRLADLQVDDLPAGGLELLRPPQDIECRFPGELSRTFMQHGSMIAPAGGLYT